MTTLSGFRTEVSSVLGLDTGASAELSLIDGWINEGVTDLLRRTQCKVLPATMTLTAGTSDYDISSLNLFQIINVYVTSGNVNYQLERATPAEIYFYRQGDSSTTSPVRRYAVEGGNWLMVYPTPSAADVLHVTYVPKPATLSVTSDTPSEIPNEYHKLVAFYALWRGADYDDDASSQMGDRYREWYETGLKEMRRVLEAKGGNRLARILVNRRRRQVVPHDPSTDA